MNLSNYSCVNCRSSAWRTYTTYWQCEPCGQRYDCVSGVPRLYLENSLGGQDRSLRDYFYDGLLGRYYQYIMPFLALPVRPNYWKGWLAYVLICGLLLGLLGYAGLLAWRLAQSGAALSAIDIAMVLMLAATALFFARHRYLLYLLVLAVPVKLSLRATKFRARTSFAEIHAGLIDELRTRKGKLQVLDISTGTCNSLFRHGWMTLDAEYTGLDLSQTMLLQGLEFMTRERVPVDFVLADATQLPFMAETFDVVLNYGALNGYSDSGRALSEMARVTKSGGVVLVLDEQLYDGASAVERLYFRRVLASHDILDRFPTELVPAQLATDAVHQVYHFYYLWVARKK
jgi:ubiquinone/menaquinone biosynthesis C-methylase UbiE